MRTRVAAVAVAAGIAAAACSGSSLKPAPSTGPPSPTVSASASPSSPAQPAVVQLHKGAASITLTGGVKDKLKLPLAPPGASVWELTGGHLSLRYLDRDGNAMLMNGAIPGSSARTSTNLTLSIVLQGKSSVPFSSSRGECRVTITHSSTTSVAGMFACSKLRSLGSKPETAGVVGRFTASR